MVGAGGGSGETALTRTCRGNVSAIVSPARFVLRGAKRTGRTRHTTAEPTVELAEYGLSFKFVGGFPEEVRFRNFDDPEGGPVLVHQWGNAIPLSRLSFTFYLSAAQWERVNGAHLTRLAALSFDALLPEVAQAIAASPHLAALEYLAATVHGSDTDAIRALVSFPRWSGTANARPDGPGLRGRRALPRE